MAEDGAAGKKFLMALTNMLAPGMLQEDDRHRYDKSKANRFSKDHQNKQGELDE